MSMFKSAISMAYACKKYVPKTQCKKDYNIGQSRSSTEYILYMKIEFNDLRSIFKSRLLKSNTYYQ